MATNADPLARSLDEWRTAWSAVTSTPHGSPEWEEATVLAEEAQWRFRGELTTSKVRLSRVSRSILRTVALLESLEAERKTLEPGSEREKTLGEEIRAAAAKLLSLAVDEQDAGEPVPAMTDSIASFERSRR